jgi:hypothetical protein
MISASPPLPPHYDEEIESQLLKRDEKEFEHL